MEQNYDVEDKTDGSGPGVSGVGVFHIGGDNLKYPRSAHDDEQVGDNPELGQDGGFLSLLHLLHLGPVRRQVDARDDEADDVGDDNKDNEEVEVKELGRLEVGHRGLGILLAHKAAVLAHVGEDLALRS